VNVGRRYFGMDLPNLNVIIQDARWGLDSSPYSYDLICVDAYRPPYIPPHLTTVEFFRMAAAHLNPGGTLVINVGRAPDDRRLIDGLATTLSQVFPSLYVMDIPNTFNSMIYATLQPTTKEDLSANIGALSAAGAPQLLLDSLGLAWANLQPAPAHTLVFTDDKAPIEWITNNMILDFLLNGEEKTLQ